MAQQGCCCSGAELIQAGAGAAHAGSESKGGGRLGKRGATPGPPHPHPARVLLPVGVFLVFLFGFGVFFNVFSLKAGAGARLAVLCRRGALGVFRDFF